jgi:hypothetical protein
MKREVLILDTYAAENDHTTLIILILNITTFSITTLSITKLCHYSECNV